MPFLTQGKTNWKFIGIVLVLAVIVGGGILAWQYFGVPKEEVKVPEEEIEEEVPEEEIEEEVPEEVVEDETADWKIYKNDELGFQIKYPDTWGYVTRKYLTVVFGPSDFDFENDSLISISFKQSNLSLDEYYTAQKNISQFFNEELISINGIQAIKANFKWGLFEGIDVFLKKGDYIYIFTLSFRPGRDKEKDAETFNQMLSTFRFLE